MSEELTALLGLKRGSTRAIHRDGEWYWWGDWTHHHLATIEHNALRLRELYDTYSKHLKSCFGACKDANDDYFYLMISDPKEHFRLLQQQIRKQAHHVQNVSLDLDDDPLCKHRLVRVLTYDLERVLDLENPRRGPNYGSGYFKWADRPPMKPEELPEEYDNFNVPEGEWPYPVPDDPYLILPPPPPPPPPDEFTGETPLKEKTDKTKQSKLFG